jgi:hypothetical protein
MMNEPLDDLLGSAIDSIAVNNTMPTYTNPTPVMNNMMVPQNNFFMQNGGGFNMAHQPMTPLTPQPTNTTPQVPYTGTKSSADVQDLASQFFASIGGMPSNTNPTPVAAMHHMTPNTMTPMTPVIPTLTLIMPSMMPTMTPVNSQPSASGDDDDFFSSATAFQTTNPKQEPTPTSVPQHFNTNPQPSNTFNSNLNNPTPATSTNIQSVADQFFANLSGLPTTPANNTTIPTAFNTPTSVPPMNAFNTMPKPTTTPKSPFAMPLQPEQPKPSPFSQAAIGPTNTNKSSGTSSGTNSRRGSVGNVPPSMVKLTTSTSVTPTQSVESSPLNTNDTSAVKRTNSKDKFDSFSVSNIIAAINTPTAPAPTSNQGFEDFFTELGKQQASNTSATSASTMQTSPFASLPPQHEAPLTTPMMPVMLTTPVDIPATPAPSLTPSLSNLSLEDAFQSAITTPAVSTPDHSANTSASTSQQGASTVDHSSVPPMVISTPMMENNIASNTFEAKSVEHQSTSTPVNQLHISNDTTPNGSTPTMLPEQIHTPGSSGSMTMTPQSDASMFKPHTPFAMMAQGSPQGSPFNTNDTSSTSGSQNLTPSVPTISVNTVTDSSLNIRALADSFFSSFQLPSVPAVSTPAVFGGESVSLDVHVNGGESPSVSLSTPLATATVSLSLTPGSQGSMFPTPTLTPVVSLTPSTPTEGTSTTPAAQPVATNLFSLYESIKSQKKPQSDKPVQLEEMLNDSMNLLYQVMDAQNSKTEPTPPIPAPATKTELTFDDEDMGDFVSAGTTPQHVTPMSVGLTPVMLPLTPMFPPQMTPTATVQPAVEDWDFPTAPTMSDISIPSTNTSTPSTQSAAPSGSSKGLQVTEDLFASIIGLKKSGESPKDPRSQISPQSPSRTVVRDAPQPKRGTVIMGKIPIETNKTTQTPAPASGKKVMQGIGPSSSSSKTTTTTSTKQQTTKQQTTKQQAKSQPKAPLGTKSTPTISKTPTLPTRGAAATKTATTAANGTKTTAPPKEAATSKRGTTIMATIPGAPNGNLKSSAGADDFFGTFNGASTTVPPTAAAKKGDSSLLMEIPKSSEGSQPPQKSLLDIFSSQAPVPLPDSLNGSAEKKVEGTFGDEFEFSDFRTAKPEPLTKSTFLAFYDPTATKPEETPAAAVEEPPKSSPSVPRVELPFSSSSQLSAHLFFEAPKSTSAPFSLGEKTKSQDTMAQVQAKQPAVTAGDVYKYVDTE